MKKTVYQFYLLLFVSASVMSLLVGLVAKFTAERAGKQSLDDLMNSSLYLMRSELRGSPHTTGVDAERDGFKSLFRSACRATE